MKQGKPTIYIFLGLPGSGKTHFSRKLSEKLGVVRLNSDSMRMAIFGSRENMREIYSSGNREILNSYVFNAIDYATEEMLAKGQSVIQDANHNRRSDRENLEKLAANYDGRVVLLHIQTSQDIASVRAQERPETIDQRKLTPNEVADIYERHAQSTTQPTESELVVEINGTDDFETQFAAFTSQMKRIDDKELESDETLHKAVTGE